MRCYEGGCIETVRSGKNYYLLLAQAREIGPLAVLSETEYKERITAVGETGDSSLMFDISSNETSSAIYPTEEELRAHTHYVRHGKLDELPDEGSFVARTDMSSAAEIEYHLPEHKFVISIN